jgi:putative heme-binding domain-containing protein
MKLMQGFPGQWARSVAAIFHRSLRPTAARGARRVEAAQGSFCRLRVRSAFSWPPFALLFCLLGGAAAAQEGATTPHWIWRATGKPPGDTAVETCYFRKPFLVKENSRLVLDVTADDSFKLYLDGALVAKGHDWRTMQAVDQKLGIGPHVLAASVSNDGRGPAGLLVRGGVLPLGQNVPVHTDASWTTTAEPQTGGAWTTLGFDDESWQFAHDLGPLGSEPWGAPAGSQDAAGRFQVPAGFRVAQVAAPAVTGSVVAFTLDEEGRPCVSVEEGPIARLVDADNDGQFESSRLITTQVRNCQGLAFVSGSLFAVGDGKEGPGIYRLADRDPDGAYRSCELVRASRGEMGEHGPHAIGLGPDGALYFMIGNHAHLKPPVDPNSPVNIAYEGELLPHMNDPSGHAAGRMAPGGEILRSDDSGRTWKRMAAGFRNAYDFAFNADGEVFTFDSDMEWDLELPWYRAVRVNHCPIGAELGWRNGSGKWPVYFFDSLPSVLDVGRGSPTGVAFYQARQFPSDYRDSLLMCDWAQGRILAVRFSRSGASYLGTASVLVSGQPLNCTDIEVGPDGAVYFSTGGRGTQGGLYRVSWDRASPARAVARPGPSAAIELDSPAASFTRRRIAEIRRADPEGWSRTLLGVVHNAPGGQTASARVRALELLCQFGPQPGAELLETLASDADARVRARAVALLGPLSGSSTRAVLRRALSDQDPFVRRRACEGLMQQAAASIPVDALLPLLRDPDRWIRHAARVALEHAAPGAHRTEILALREPRSLVEGMLALVRAGRIDADLQDELLKRETALLEARLPADLACDVLRLVALTYMLGPHQSEAAASKQLRPVLSALFSTSTDSPLNREVARLLAYLDEPSAVPALLEHQARVPSHTAQIHDAYCLRAMKRGWTAEGKQRLWRWFETSSHWEGGYSFRGYLDTMIASLVALLDQKERDAYLVQGERFPFPTRVLVRGLDLASDPGPVDSLLFVYAKLGQPTRTGPGAELPGLIIEKLGQSPGSPARAALRTMYLHPADPLDRGEIAAALARHAGEEDFDILAGALDAADARTLTPVLEGLGRLKTVPHGPDALVSLLRAARRAGLGAAELVSSVAARWTRTTGPKNDLPFDQTLAAWEAIYRKRFPDGPALGPLPPLRQQTYTLPLLVQAVLNSEIMKSASSRRGERIIKRARCLECHKFGSQGSGVGPDLTTVSSRFRRVEILEAIVDPSKVVSDQYKSIDVVTLDGKVYNGMPVASDGSNLVLLLSDGSKATISRSEIDSRKHSPVSVMPAGLIDSLSHQEIADLLALFDSAPRTGAAEPSH